MKSKDIKANKNNDWEYFDDCLVCQAMKVSEEEEERDLTKEELEISFAKQNLQNKLDSKK